MTYTIKTWQERTTHCEAPRHHDFYSCMMQAEIDELRAALAQQAGKCTIADHMKMANESLRQASEHSYKIAMATRTLAPKGGV